MRKRFLLPAVALLIASIGMVTTAVPANAGHLSRCEVNVTITIEPQDPDDVFRFVTLSVPIIVRSDSTGLISDALGPGASLECTPIPHSSG